ncbi:glycosyltransferase family 4 protein [bacterium]|nr:MAG: glycosyltransferase family 4 protein [bacterium]
MKVLIVAMKFFPASGGSASYAYNMAIGLHRLGYDITVMAPTYSHRTMDDRLFPFKVKRLVWSGPQFGMFRLLFAAVHLFVVYRKNKPDIIWTTSFAGCRVLGLLTNLKARFIGTVHGGGIHRRYPSRKLSNKFGDRLGLRFMKRADAIVTISEESKKIFAAKLPYDIILNKLRLIYNSIDFDESKFVSKSAALEKLPHLQTKQVILTVARLVSAKGHDVVIRALNILKFKHPDAVYVIVGEGVERPSLERLVKDLHLEDRVIFAGYVNDEQLERYYGVCDVFVMAGRWTSNFVEGFGLVYIEAGVRGKPVIGTRVGGIPEAIVENKSGFVIEPENPEALAEKISLLLTDESLRNGMSRFAVQYVKESFSNDVMAKHNASLLSEL